MNVYFNSLIDEIGSQCGNDLTIVDTPEEICADGYLIYPSGSIEQLETKVGDDEAVIYIFPEV